MRRPATEKLSGNQVSRMQRHFVAVVTGVFVLLILWAAAVPLVSWFELNRRADALQTAAQRWRQNGYPDYRYRLSIDCDCDFRTDGPISISVTDSRFSAASAPLPRIEGFPRTVDEGFEFVGGLLDRYPDAVEVEFHEVYGYPSRVFVDFDDAESGDELTYLVDSLQPDRIG